MKTCPLISVIIPVYNVEQYLEECVDSVLKQTYKNIEIILVDDGSTDSSGKLCDKYAKVNENIKVYHKKNGGQSTARNFGFDVAEGKYIYFLDSDDYIVCDALEKLCSLAETDNADIVFFDAYSFLDNSKKEIKQNYKRNHIYTSKKGMDVFSEMQENGEYHASVPLLFIKKQFLDANNIVFVSGIYYEDLAYTFELLCLAERVSQCKEVLYYRRYRENSTMTSKKTKKYFDSSIVLYEAVRDFSSRKGIAESDVAKKHMTRIAFNIFNNFDKLTSSDKSMCRDDFRKAKKNILDNNSYGNTALKMRCYSKILWFVYKIYEKTLSGF